MADGRLPQTAPAGRRWLSAWRLDAATAFGLLGAQLVKKEGLDQNRCFLDKARLETGPLDEGAQQVEVGVRGEEDVEAATGREPRTCLLEEGQKIPVARTGVPGSVGD